MKRTCTVGFALATGIYAAALAADPKAPEVGDWDVALKPLGDNEKASPYQDVLSFKDGKLQSKTNAKYGFEAAAYTKKTVAGGLEISAVQKSGEHGSATWNLKVKGDELSGTLVWEKKEKKFRWEFAFSGKRK